MQQHDKPQLDSNSQIRAVRRYYRQSRIGYNLFLKGAKHFGYRVRGQPVEEVDAIVAMHDRVAGALQLGRSDVVLDAGCGQGVVATDLAKRYGCKIHGITVVPFEIAYATKRASDYDVSNIATFSLMDYASLDFKDQYFDAVFTLETLSHAASVKQVVKEFHRVLKPGGRLALFEYVLSDESAFSLQESRIVDKVMIGSAMMGLREFRHEAIVAMLFEAGYKEVAVDDITDNVLPSLARLRRYAALPYIPVRCLAMQERFPNVTAAVEFHKMVSKRLIRYCVFQAKR